MANVVKKENMTIAIREYTDGQGNKKKVWKTIGELITWDDGKQSFEIWGAGGLTKGSVFAQDNQGQQQAPQQQAQGFQNPPPAPQGGFQQQPHQQQYRNQAPQQPNGFGDDYDFPG